MPRVHRASVTVRADSEAVWTVLSDPTRHATFDASDTVGEAVTQQPLTRLGQVFRMNMNYDDGTSVTHYRTDNHVSALEPLRRIAWDTAVVGEPPLGWTWRYDLEPIDGGTRVTLTYDWSATSPQNIEQYGVPNQEPDDLRRSLRRLAEVVEG